MRVAGVVAAALLVVSPAAAAQEPPRQSASSSFTTIEPGAPTGGRLDVQVRDPADPNAKPRTLSRLVVEYPEGARFDFTVPETCTATDAELMQEGAAACPPGSAVADGTLRTDNGSPGEGRYTDNTLTTFSAGQGELVTLAESREPPTRVVSRSPVQGSKVTLDYPAVPASPPPEPFLAYTRLQLNGFRLVKGDTAFLTTPPSCPAEGAWRGALTFTYRDGVTQRVETRSPCRRSGEPAFAVPAPPGAGPGDDAPFEELRDAAAPAVRLGALPRRCVRRAFLVRVAARGETALRHVIVQVDGRRVALRRSATFRVRIPAARLQRGRHRIDVLARDRAGDLGGATARFRRC